MRDLYDGYHDRSSEYRYDEDGDEDDDEYYSSDEYSSSSEDDDDRSYDDVRHDDGLSFEDEERSPASASDLGRRPLLRTRSFTTTTTMIKNARRCLSGGCGGGGIRRRFDLKSTANFAVLTCALWTAVRLAGSELSTLERRNDLVVRNSFRSSSGTIADFDPLIFTPSPETRSRLSEEFFDPTFFEYGESNARERMAFLTRHDRPPDYQGERLYEYGEFSGVAVTPDQYARAREYQTKLREEFVEWVQRTAPADYYDKTIRKKEEDKNQQGNSMVEVVAEGEVTVPDLEGYKDVWEPFDPKTDTPIFFHIPKAGGTTIKNVVGTCHRLTMATEVGIMNGHDQDTAIAVVRPYANPAEGKEGTAFVNVDTTTAKGLKRAADLGLAPSGLAEIVITPLIHEAKDLFTPEAPGRVFTLFRHPLDRALSMFYYIQVADWEPTYTPELATMTIEDYVTSGYVENNWVVRRLADVDRSVRLEQKHLAAAMDVARRKFLVGLLEKKEESLERFEKFFGWTFVVKPDNQERCRASLLAQGANQNLHADLPDEGTEAYDALIFHNRWDLLLYEYIEGLFVQQAAFVEGVADNFRMEDATCAKCVPPTFPVVL